MAGLDAVICVPGVGIFSGTEKAEILNTVNLLASRGVTGGTDPLLKNVVESAVANTLVSIAGCVDITKTRTVDRRSKVDGGRKLTNKVAADGVNGF